MVVQSPLNLIRSCLRREQMAISVSLEEIVPSMKTKFFFAHPQTSAVVWIGRCQAREWPYFQPHRTCTASFCCPSISADQISKTSQAFAVQLCLWAIRLRPHFVFSHPISHQIWTDVRRCIHSNYCLIPFVIARRPNLRTSSICQQVHPHPQASPRM